MVSCHFPTFHSHLEKNKTNNNKHHQYPKINLQHLHEEGRVAQEPVNAEAVEAPPLEVFMTWLDKAAAALIFCWQQPNIIQATG